jgi:hypothetical protein
MLNNVPAPGYDHGAAGSQQSAVEELNELNFHDLVLDKGHVKVPVFVYCVPA